MISQKCLWCGKEKFLEKYFDKNEFQKNNHNPICKDCKSKIKSLDEFKLYLKDSGIEFDQNTWNKAEQLIKDKLIKKYKNKDLPSNFSEMVLKNTIGRFNSLGNLSGDFKLLSVKNDNNRNKKQKIKIDKNDLEELKLKYGYGYPDEEYMLFEQKYQQLRPSFQLLTTMHDECLREYCVNKVKETLAKARGDFKEAKDWATMAKDVATSGKLNPSQMSKADLSGGLDTFGQVAKAIEQEVDILPLLPIFIERPKDKVDIVLWYQINYIRGLKGLPDCEYKEIYDFYEKRKEDYEKQMLDNDFLSKDTEDMDLGDLNGEA